MDTDHRNEIAASVAAHQHLGPGYEQALAEGLVERISTEIDDRITAQIDQRVSAEVDDRMATGLDQHLGCRHVRRASRRALRASRRAQAAQSGRPSIIGDPGVARVRHVQYRDRPVQDHVQHLHEPWRQPVGSRAPGASCSPR